MSEKIMCVQDYLLVICCLEYILMFIGKLLIDIIFEKVFFGEVGLQDVWIFCQIFEYQVQIVEQMQCYVVVCNFCCVVEFIVIFDECILVIYNVLCLFCFLQVELLVIVDELEYIWYVIVNVVFVWELVEVYQQWYKLCKGS